MLKPFTYLKCFMTSKDYEIIPNVTGVVDGYTVKDLHVFIEERLFSCMVIAIKDKYVDKVFGFIF